MKWVVSDVYEVWLCLTVYWGNSPMPGGSGQGRLQVSMASKMCLQDDTIVCLITLGTRSAVLQAAGACDRRCTPTPTLD